MLFSIKINNVMKEIRIHQHLVLTPKVHLSSFVSKVFFVQIKFNPILGFVKQVINLASIKRHYSDLCI